MKKVDLEAFYDEHSSKLYKFFYYKVLNRHVAEDLTSDTFLVFAQKIHDTKVPITKAYLYGVAANKWNGYLRDKYNKPTVLIEDSSEFIQLVEEFVETNETVPIKDRAKIYIDLLPESQRQVATMRLLQEDTVGDIAKALGKNKNYVKVTLRRAMRNLERLIALGKEGL